MTAQLLARMRRSFFMPFTDIKRPEKIRSNNELFLDVLILRKLWDLSFLIYR